MSLCHGRHRRLNFTGKSSYFFTVFSLVANTYTAIPPLSLPWENQHHLNIHTVIQVSSLSICETVWLWTLLIVVLSRLTVFAIALGLCQMADFQASYMLYLSGISNAIYLKKCEKWEEKGTILMRENASANRTEGKCFLHSNGPVLFQNVTVDYNCQCHG